MTSDIPVNAIVLYSSDSLPETSSSLAAVVQLPVAFSHARPQIYRRLYRNIQGRYKSAFKYIPSCKQLSTEEILGCNIHEYINYLEDKMLPSMSWYNYGKTGWHVDHIIGVENWDLTNRRHVRSCFHYTNTQPLWARLNYKKSKRVINVDVSLYLLPAEPEDDEEKE